MNTTRVSRLFLAAEVVGYTVSVILLQYHSANDRASPLLRYFI